MPGAARAFRIEPCHKRVRTYLAGELVADTLAPLLVWEGPNYPVYYLPAADIRAELVPAGETEHSPSRGEAEVLDVKVRRHRRAGRAALPGLAAGGTARPGPAGLGRDERVAGGGRAGLHPPARPVQAGGHPGQLPRHVRVEIDGVTVAESRQPRILFETGLPPRYYLPLTDLRMDLLRPSDAESHRPYKGTRQLLVGGHRAGRRHRDIVWIYRAPLPESQKIAGLACFYNEKVDIYLDGERQEQPAHTLQLTGGGPPAPARAGRRCPRSAPATGHDGRRSHGRRIPPPASPAGCCRRPAARSRPRSSPAPAVPRRAPGNTTHRPGRRAGRSVPSKSPPIPT